MVNKDYYFGVGGSLEGFKEHLELVKELEIEKSIEINTKKTNKKTILILIKNSI